MARGLTLRSRHNAGLKLTLASVVAAGCGLSGENTIELLPVRERDAAAPRKDAQDDGRRPDSGASSRCRSDAECSPLRCDPGVGRCVECLAPSDCGTVNRTCEKETRRCVDGCSVDIACPEVTPHCDVATGRCLSCTMDLHCASSGDDIRCDLRLGRCVDCVSDDHCTDPERNRCEPLFRECVRCVRDEHCPPGYHCTGPAGFWQCAP